VRQGLPEREPGTVTVLSGAWFEETNPFVAPSDFCNDRVNAVNVEPVVVFSLICGIVQVGK
jgi:hypothetical protein